MVDREYRFWLWLYRKPKNRRQAVLKTLALVGMVLAGLGFVIVLAVGRWGASSAVVALALAAFSPILLIVLAFAYVAYWSEEGWPSAWAK